ncbi:MAG: pyruvate dehydrogenase complex dihydrolipoamide acetyltransferase [Saprospiraceae bacterium]|nr:pyruvate dehydrogenase complex dihydrolipoamide acetyltransferase [Saprospiraceae bacterium]
MAEVITMPRLSDSMEEGEIVAWHKKVGDKVAKGDLLAEINSDKATMDFESPKAGTLLYVGIPAGDKLSVGAPLVVIGDEGEAFAHLLGGAAAAPVAEAAAPTAAVSTAAAVVVASATPSVSAVETHDQSRIFASPLAKEIAKASGIEIQTVQGSGDNGRIVKRDVEAAVSKAATTTVVTTTSVVSTPAVQIAVAKPTPSVSAAFGNEDYTDQPLTSMRKVIAKRLSESLFTAPHFYLTMEINMDKAMELRTQLNAVAAPVKLSFNDIVVKAVAVTLRNHPAINSSWMGDFIRQNKHVNIGVAVAVGQSLFVPVIRNTDMKSLGQISSEVRALAGKAKEGKLQLPEMQGSTFTISNLGMFDIEEFTAIINSPDSCILAVGSIMQKPVVKNGEIVVGNVMKITLSCDHRVVDGATGAIFLQELKAKLEDPIRLLV